MVNSCVSVIQRFGRTVRSVFLSPMSQTYSAGLVAVIWRKNWFQPGFGRELETLAEMSVRVYKHHLQFGKQTRIDRNVGLPETDYQESSMAATDLARTFWELQMVNPNFEKSKISIYRGYSEAKKKNHEIAVIQHRDAYIALDPVFGLVQDHEMGLILEGHNSLVLVTAQNEKVLLEELKRTYKFWFFKQNEGPLNCSYMRTAYLDPRRVVYRPLVEDLAA